MNKTMGSRLVRLEQGAGLDQNTPAWLAVRKWLGHALTADQEAEIAAWEAELPPYDPMAPVDTRGWSQEMREWLGYSGPGRENHTPYPGARIGHS